LKDSIKGADKEDDLLRQIIDTVGVSLGQGEKMESAPRNPEKAVSDMMSSGALTNLMTNMTKGMESGDLDLSKLMGSIQGMVCNMGGEGKDANIPPEVKNMTDNLNNMIRSVSSNVMSEK